MNISHFCIKNCKNERDRIYANGVRRLRNKRFL